MKTITVKNLTIRFDSFDNETDKQKVIDILLKFNDELQQQFPDDCPEIFINAIDDDIEIDDPCIEDQTEF